MELFGLKAEYLATILETLKKYPQVKEALIFGSRANGKFKEASDVDIALKGDLDFNLLSKIKYEFENHNSIPLFFDVIRYETIQNTALKEHIDNFGKTLYKKAPSN